MRALVFASLLLGACSLVNPTADFSDGIDSGMPPEDASRTDTSMPDTGVPPTDSGTDAMVMPDAGPMIDPTAPQQIAASWRHTCAISDGSVYCWGANQEGQLGDGTLTDRLTPTQVTGVPGTAVEVTAMGWQSCARTDAGEIWCWGDNSIGQLGDGTMTDSPTPVRAAPSISDAVRISLGGANGCAVRANGEVVCWGRGDNGGLGNGSLTPSLVPVPVSDTTSPLDLDGSGGHFCVRTDDDRASCWGWNGYGQLGQPFTSDADIIPMPVSPPGLSGILEISAGGRHTCARTDSVVACWGWNMFEQLGAPGSDSYTPVVVGGALTDLPVAIAAGGSHTCAAMSGGSDVFCWGGNTYGQLGVGDTAAHTGPQEVSGFTSRVVELDAGDYHTCARLDTDVLACWGLNMWGNLGTGDTTDALTPRVIVVGP